MTITKEVFDDYVEKSFFNQYNFSGRFTPSKISSNMIPYKDLQEFHYQTSFTIYSRRTQSFSAPSRVLSKCSLQIQIRVA